MHHIVKLVVAFATATLMVGMLVGPAGAVAPERNPYYFAEQVDFPAGTICDFDYRHEIVVTGFEEVYFDKAGNFVRSTLHWQASAVHTNLSADPDYVLTEEARGSSTFNEETQTVRIVGVQWHLKDASGRVVVTHAGQLVYDIVNDELTVTPNFGAEFPEVICPALGGQPA